MTMETLPIEVLTHILQFLSPIDRLRSERVCKKWRNASRHTWRDVQTLYIIKPTDRDCFYRFKNCFKTHKLVGKEDNRLFIGSDSPEIIRSLISRAGCFIKKLIFDYLFSENSRVILSYVNNYCHNLRIFGMRPPISRNDKELFSKLFECNKELHSFKFTVTQCFVESLPLRDWKSLRFVLSSYEKKIVEMIEHSEALEEFETTSFTKPIVEALRKCRNLKSLYYTTPYNKESCKWISDISLLNRLTNLRVFTSEPDIDRFCNMLQHCCQLKMLEINDQHKGIEVKLLETIQALPVLETLKLWSYSITDDMLIYLMKYKNLCLIAASITDNGILKVIKESEVLEKLDIERTATTPKMWKQLVREMSDRPKYLEVMVGFRIFNKVSRICEGSKIRVVRDMQCFKNRFD